MSRPPRPPAPGTPTPRPRRRWGAVCPRDLRLPVAHALAPLAPRRPPPRRLGDASGLRPKAPSPRASTGIQSPEPVGPRLSAAGCHRRARTRRRAPVLPGARRARAYSFGERPRLMCSILDIDLDYFNLAKDPIGALEDLLRWGGRPVDFVVERHSHALRRWKRQFHVGRIPAPSHVLHVDEHHDMMDEKTTPNIGNVMYHVMRSWPRCRVHWLVQHPIDSPAMWLTEATWNAFRRRFSLGPERPRDWPRPDIVSVCTSPAFLPSTLTQRLSEVVQGFQGAHCGRKSAEQTAQRGPRSRAAG